jgi:hypothetical protein
MTFGIAHDLPAAASIHLARPSRSRPKALMTHLWIVLAVTAEIAASAFPAPLLLAHR